MTTKRGLIGIRFSKSRIQKDMGRWSCFLIVVISDRSSSAQGRGHTDNGTGIQEYGPSSFTTLDELRVRVTVHYVRRFGLRSGVKELQRRIAGFQRTECKTRGISVDVYCCLLRLRKQKN
jgi:hypothetical protein